MLKIKIDNRDLAYTIDSYQTFTMDGDDEQIRANMIEDSEMNNTPDGSPRQGNDETIEPGLDYPNFDDRYQAEYDHSGYVKHLAQTSVNTLHTNLVNRWDYSEPDEHGTRQKIYDNIVLNIELDQSTSPAFYNYTTDSYTALWTINELNLGAWIGARLDEYDDFIKDEYDLYDRINKFDLSSKDYDATYVTISMIDYYTRTVYDIEEYQNDMYENSSAYEYITYKKIEKSNNDVQI